MYKKKCTFAQILQKLNREDMQITSSILANTTRLVIFDLDGTLYSKKGMMLRMICAAPLDGVKMLADRITRKRLRGIYLQDETAFYEMYFQTMASYCKQSPVQLRDWYFGRYLPLMVEVIGANYKPVGWLSSFVSICKERNIRLVVLSDYSYTHQKLHALGIDNQQFDLVISAPELGGLKPAHQLLSEVAGRFAIRLDECLVIGDRDDTDGQLARAGGARFWLVQ